MEWIALAFMLELGVLPFDQTVMYDPPAIVMEDWIFYTRMEAEVRLLDNHLFVGGSIEIREWKHPDTIAFWPERAGFAFNAGLRWGMLELGFLHYCTHPVILSRIQGIEWEGAYEKIYLRISGEVTK